MVKANTQRIYFGICLRAFTSATSVMPKSMSREGADFKVAVADLARNSGLSRGPTHKATARAGRIMYIECKAGELTGPARIGRVTFSKTGRTLYYHGQRFQSLKGAGFKSNYFDVDTGEDYWISGPKRDGSDRLYGESTPAAVDDDIREK